MRTENLRLPAYPDTIGRYEVVSLLGEGGMARVYLAMQRGPFAATKLLAIKHLRAEVSHDDQFLNMFVDEARIALRLNHPNVVHTYEVVADGEEYYLLMEFLEGQTLMNLLRYAGREAIPLSDHLWVLTQVLAGLQYAHDLRDFDGTRLNVVHRDVSPSNVFVTYAGEVKLLDFGIAKAAGAISATQQGIMKGKLGYAAPEQCLGRPVDNRTDVYAVGVMLWEAMAKKRRWSGETQHAMMQARITNTEPSIEEVWPEVPMALAAISRRALAKDPDERYASAAELQADLEQFLKTFPRPPGPESIARLMAETFEEERDAMRRTIEERIGSTRYSLPAAATHSGPLSISPKSSRSSEVSEVGPASARSSQPSDAESSRSASGSHTGPSRMGWLASISAGDAAGQGRRTLFIALCLGGLATLGLAFWVRGRGTQPAVPAGVITNSPMPTLSATPPKLALEPATLPVNSAASSGPTLETPSVTVPQEIKGRISVSPTWATVHLDGKKLEKLPFDGNLPRDQKPHRLNVSASGHEALERTVSFDRDFDLELSLRPLRSGARKRRDEPTTSFVLPGPGAPAASSRGERSNEPGQDLRNSSGNRSLRGIDEADPYK